MIIFYMDLFCPDRLPVPLQVQPCIPTCDGCGSDDLLFPDNDHVGSVVCACGQVQPQVYVDKRPKFKGHKDEDMVKDECVDMFIDPTLPKSSMTIVMSNGGNVFFQQLRRLQNGYLPSDERATLHIMDFIRSHTDTRRFPSSVVQDAAILFRKLQSNSKVQGDCTRGEIRRALIASCVLYTCRTVRVIKTPEEVARAFDLSDEHFTKGWARFLDICAHRGFADMSLEPLQARDFIYRCGKRLHLTWPVTQVALAMADLVRERQWCNNNTPSSVAGALLMLVHGMLHGTMSTPVELRPLLATLTAADQFGATYSSVAPLCDMSVTTLQKIVKTLQSHWWPDTVSPPPRPAYRKNKKRGLEGVPSLET